MGYLRKPSYYSKFSCIASACTDTCCAGWEIDIDEETLEFYQQVPGAFGELLRSKICFPSQDEPAHFLEDKNERCPFLDEQNLCEIYRRLGEEHLSYICTHHPRFYEWYQDGQEAGLGICCEEAARQILTPENRGKDCFETILLPDAEESLSEEIGDEEEEAWIQQTEQLLFQMRDTLFSCLTSPLSTLGAYDQLLTDLMQLAVSNQVSYDQLLYQETEITPFFMEDCLAASTHFWNPESHEETAAFLDFCLSLEVNSPQWWGLLREIKDQLAELISLRPAFFDYYKNRFYEYECLLQYFLYRYFMKALGDDCLIEKVNLAILSVQLILLLGLSLWHKQGTLSLTDQINLCKLFSKEIEYDEGNIEKLSGYGLSDLYQA